MELTEIEMLKNKIAYLESRPNQLEEEALKLAKLKQRYDELEVKLKLEQDSKISALMALNQAMKEKEILSNLLRCEKKEKEKEKFESQSTESKPAGYLSKFSEAEITVENLREELEAVKGDRDNWAKLAKKEADRKAMAIEVMEKTFKENVELKSQLTESKPDGHLNSYRESESMIEKLQREIIQQKAFLRSATDQIQRLDKVIAQKNEEIHSLSEQLNECNLDQNRATPGDPMNPKKCEESKEFQLELSRDIDEIYSMLVEKNASYGNSALDPIRVFSNVGPMEQIMVRIDDKLSRIKRGKEYPGDNDVKDLIGYFFLFLQAERKLKQVSEEPE